MYSIVWLYTIKPGQQEVFEHEYGGRGSWHALFSKSAFFRGSVLHKSDDEPYTYLLIDTWTDKQSYEEFLAGHRAGYNKLNKTFRNLYYSEERIGTFSQTK